MCSAIQSGVPTASEVNVNSTDNLDDLELDLLSEDDDESDESRLTVDDVVEELTRQLDTDNEIEPVIRPTKKRQQAHIRSSASHSHHNHPMSDPMPYYPAPAPMPYAMPYSQCPYNQPLYYPQPMYPPYPYPPYSPIQFAEQQSPPKIVKAVDPTDTTEVVNVEQLLKIANFWNKFNATAFVPQNSTKKGGKRFALRNWIRNKLNKFTIPAPIAG